MRPLHSVSDETKGLRIEFPEISFELFYIRRVIPADIFLFLQKRKLWIILKNNLFSNSCWLR